MSLPDTNKRLGQHWLTDETILSDIAAEAELTAEDTVLEIGPGPGTLTSLLVKQAGNVIAVELDAQLATDLPKAVPAPNLQVVVEDILQFDLTSLPAGYKVVANIPYYLTSNLIRILSESSNPPAIAVLLVQKEVAERVAAEPGQTSLLSISSQFYFDVYLGPVVPARLFTPPPKVDSQVVILKSRQSPMYPDILDTKYYFRIVKAGFAGRRKTISNSLSAGLQLSKDEARALLERAGIDPKLRAQNLSLDDWHRLYLTIQGDFR